MCIPTIFIFVSCKSEVNGWTIPWVGSSWGRKVWKKKVKLSPSTSLEFWMIPQETSLVWYWVIRKVHVICTMLEDGIGLLMVNAKKICKEKQCRPENSGFGWVLCAGKKHKTLINAVIKWHLLRLKARQLMQKFHYDFSRNNSCKIRLSSSPVQDSKDIVSF